MSSISDGIITTYSPGVNKDQFVKDKISFKGKFYAVKVDDKIVIKQVFFSFGSFFSFIGDLVFNNKNTFLLTKSINQLVNDLPQPAKKVSTVGASTLQQTALTPTRTPEISFTERYYNFVDLTFPFIDGWISNLSNLKVAKSDEQLMQYVQSEIISIEEMIARKEEEAKLFDKDKNNPKYNDAFERIDNGFATLKRDLAEIKKQINKTNEVESIASVAPSPGRTNVPGIRNAGNSCYMNSALQGLLSSPLIVDRIKNYNKNPVPAHERYMPALKKFLTAYEHYKAEPDSATSTLVGSCAAELRREIFNTRLKHLDVRSVTDMADADLILMVLGEALNLEYTFVTRLTATEGKNAQGRLVQKPVINNTPSRQLVWPEIKTRGIKGQPSLQDAFNQQCVKAGHDTNKGWRAEAIDGTPLTVDDADICYRLEGDPPPIIAFKVGKSKGAGQDDTFKPYIVSERDELLDIKNAYDKPPAGSTKYRLIAVCENHARVHWTAKAKRGSSWFDCNDSVVTRLGKGVPEANGAVMIYERIP